MSSFVVPFMLLLLLLSSFPSTTHSEVICNVVTDCGAVADNTTNSAPAIAACAQRCNTIVFPAQNSIKSGSIDISNTYGLHLLFEENAGLYGSDDTTLYPVTIALPYQGANATQWQALLAGSNASGLTISGPPSSRIDGCGWPWWANFTNGTLAHQRPKLFEILDSKDILLEGMTFANSAFWTLHPMYSQNITFRNITVLAPRAVGNTDGIDPDSCEDVLIENCLVDVGDDGISIKSGNYYQEPYQLIPSANILIVNTTVLSRNVAIGSACFGNITNVTMIGGRIGDDEGSSPWAIKIKTHIPNGGVVSGITFQDMKIGAIAPNTWQQKKGGNALQILLEEYGSSRGAVDLSLPLPSPTIIENINFLRINVTSAVQAGTLVAESPFSLSGLVFEDVFFGHVKSGWSCQNIQNHTTTEKNLVPALPAGCGQ